MREVLFQPFPMLEGRRAQVWRHHPAFRRPRHFHEEPELNLVVRGSAVMGVGDRELRVEAGEMLFFQPGQDHVLLESSADFDLFVMALTPELAARAGGVIAGASGRVRRVDDAELVAVAATLEGLGHVQDATAVEGRLTALFLETGRAASPGHVVSRRALESLRAEPTLSGATLAERLRTAPSGMSRRFHRDLGVTMVEYRARLRLIEFIRAVDQGRSLGRAALDAEFGSYAQCHRVFRRLVGVTPRDYFAGAREVVDEATVSQPA